MSEPLDAQAELLKLARVLGVETETIGYLDGAPSKELREFREALTGMLFAEGRGAAGRLAAASKPLPAQAAAKFGRALGPELCARVAGALGPERAIEVASHLRPEFLAEVAIHIDPRRARDVIAGQPPATVATVTPILVEREEWVTMGRFLGSLSDAAIKAATAAIDGEGLLRTGFVTEGKEQLDQVVADLPDEQLSSVIEAACEHGLWPEALDLVGQLGEPTLRRLAALEVVNEPSTLDQIIAAATGQELWLDLLPLSHFLPEPAKRHVAAQVTTVETAVLLDILHSAGERDLWPQMIELIALMDDAGMTRVSELIGEVREEEIFGLVGSIVQHELYEEILAIGRQIPEPQFSTIARQLVELGAEPLTPAIVAAAQQTGLWEPGLELLVAVGPELQEKLIGPVSRLEAGERETIAGQARELGMLDRLGPLAPVLEG